LDGFREVFFPDLAQGPGLKAPSGRQISAQIFPRLFFAHPLYYTRAALVIPSVPQIQGTNFAPFAPQAQSAEYWQALDEPSAKPPITYLFLPDLSFLFATHF